MGWVESLNGGSRKADGAHVARPLSPHPTDLLADLCASCGRCCKYLVAYYPREVDPLVREPFREWAKARGMTRVVEGDKPGLEAWLIPSVCPQLKDNRCMVQELKPQACLQWEPWDAWGADRPPIDCEWLKVGREV